MTSNNSEGASACIWKEFHQALTQFDVVGRCRLARVPLPTFLGNCSFMNE